MVFYGILRMANNLERERERERENSLRFVAMKKITQTLIYKTITTACDDN
jgi:hypothetical protein